MPQTNKPLQSFKYAFNGIITLFRETPNTIIHILVGVVVIILGFALNISSGEWTTIIIVIGFVFAMELLNTALEELSNYACKRESHPLIKKTKDLAAAAVLIAAITSLIVGIIIFAPKIINLL